MSGRAEEIEKLVALRSGLRALTHAGASYAELGGADFSIDEQNALKQFVHRDASSPRMTQLLKKFIGNSANISKLQEKYRIDLSRICDSLIKRESTKYNLDIIIKPHNKWLDASTHLKFADKYVFIRKTLENRIISIPIDIFIEDNMIYYVAYIVGQYGSRIIFGRIFRAINIIYFRGVVYKIHDNIDKTALFKLNLAHDDFERKNMLGDNCIGFEDIVINSNSISDVVFPVGFSGIDGDGFPIIGSGLLVNLDGLPDYDQEENAGSHKDLAGFVEKIKSQVGLGVQKKIQQFTYTTNTVDRHVKLNAIE